MEYSAEYKKCIQDPIYFMEHYAIVNDKRITLAQSQKSLLKRLMSKHGIK